MGSKKKIMLLFGKPEKTYFHEICPNIHNFLPKVGVVQTYNCFPKLLFFKSKLKSPFFCLSPQCFFDKIGENNYQLTEMLV